MAVESANKLIFFCPYARFCPKSMCVKAFGPLGFSNFARLMTYPMLLLPNCKINIGLNVVSRRPDGYHDLETLFYPVPLRDNLEIKAMDEADADGKDYRMTLGGYPVEGCTDDNLVVRVFRSLQQEFHLPPLDIYLHKLIPMGAGLGGGSSDAAFMMKGLNELFDLGLSDDDMERRMASFGADCAFFIRDKAAYATGIGDRLTPHPLSLKGKYIVLVKPDIFVSTREAYAGIRPQKPAVQLLDALELPIAEWRDKVVNDFELSVFPHHPELPAVKQTLYDMGALYASMSGSGSTLYGLFDRPVPEAAKVFEKHFVYQKQFAL